MGYVFTGEQTLALPYFTVDALFDYALRSLFLTDDFFYIRRKIITTGSVRYIVKSREKGEPEILFGAVELISIGEHDTWLRFYTSDTFSEHYERDGVSMILSILFGHIILAMKHIGQGQPFEMEMGDEEVRRTLKQISQLRTSRSTALPKKTGSEEPVNREAREDLKRGVERKAVFQKWATAKKYDLLDPVIRKKADDAFRQMLRYKPKPDRDVM